jgi:hypothetical protein
VKTKGPLAVAVDRKRKSVFEKLQIRNGSLVAHRTGISAVGAPVIVNCSRYFQLRDLQFTMIAWLLLWGLADHGDRAAASLASVPNIVMDATVSPPRFVLGGFQLEWIPP